MTKPDEVPFRFTDLPYRNLQSCIDSQKYLADKAKNADAEIARWTKIKEESIAALARKQAEEPGLRAAVERAKIEAAKEIDKSREDKQAELEALKRKIAALQMEVGEE